MIIVYNKQRLLQNQSHTIQKLNNAHKLTKHWGRVTLLNHLLIESTSLHIVDVMDVWQKHQSRNTDN